MIKTAYNMGEKEGMVDSPQGRSASAAAEAAGRPRTCGTEV